MSRIGKRVLTIPAGVNVLYNEHVLTVKGPKGELSLNIIPSLDVKIDGTELTVQMLKDDSHTSIMQGTTNSNIENMIVGVTDGYVRGLEIIGVGYRFNVKGKVLQVQDGKSHLDNLDVPEGIQVKAISNTEIELSGIDKCAIGQFAAEIRSLRKPEPYKGKGIRYKGEIVRRKEGKKASK